MRSRLARDHVEGLPPARGGVVRLRGLGGLSDFVEKAAPELAANAMLCAVNQAAYLLKRQLENQGETFVKNGGFTESLYSARKPAKESGAAAKAWKPACPVCGKAMVLRKDRKGARSGQSFWGCSGYTDCKGKRQAASDKYDGSDG